MITRSISKFCVSIVAAATLFALPSMSRAQTPDFRAQVNIPFAFEAGTLHYAPGVYMLDMLNEHILGIRSRSNSGQSMTMWEISSKPATKSKVIFHRYGDRYFLAEVWNENNTSYLKCLKSSAERQARQQLAHQNRAANDSNGTNVEVASLEMPR